MSTDSSALKLAIVVVNKNGDRFLDACLNSIFNQAYPNLEVIMIDGASTDRSLEIIEKYKPQLSHFVSEKDHGQYDAVQKGFALCNGDIMAWINSDDTYLPGAFASVNRIFQDFAQVEWLMGYPGEIDENGVLLRRLNLPWSRWSKYRYLTFDFQFIQQESCFWRRELWLKSKASISANTKLAGDLSLWLQFFRHAELYTTIASLAAFRQHSNEQRSRKFRSEYLKECRDLIAHERASFSVAFHLKLSILRIIGLFLWPFYFYEIPFLKFAYQKLYRIPKLINYNMDEFKFEFSEGVIKLPPLFIGKTNFTQAFISNLFTWKKK